MNQNEIERFKADMVKRGVQVQGVVFTGPQNPNWIGTTAGGSFATFSATTSSYALPVTDLQLAGVDHRIRMIQERLLKPIEETVTE